MAGKVHIYREFDSYDDARDFEVRTLTLYAPEGYDTQVEVCMKKEGHRYKYVVQGHRYASCD